MSSSMTIAHVTHEAKAKIGGIGAVLEGFFTSQAYLKEVKRSIVIGPLFSTEGSVLNRLGDDGEVLYSSMDGLTTSKYATVFQKIEGLYNVSIIYGRRTFVDTQTGITSSPEVILIDVKSMYNEPVNELKRQLFEKFGIRSDLYQHLWDYEEYVRLALPAMAALKGIGAAAEQTTIISHEFMGMPTAMMAMLDHDCDFRTVFYAHEVATMRRIVEAHPGHDTMFYNAMQLGCNDDLYVEDVFGDQNDFFKHPLVQASKHCDSICAVGDYTARELSFLSPEFKDANIETVYNGIPAYQIDLAERLESKARLQQYCQNLLKFRPDYIFTHVTRLVQSKGLWRDLRVLENVDRHLAGTDKTAVMFLLSTEVAQREGVDIHNMEAEYGWPIAHREGWPDLSGGEARFYTAIQQFNSHSQNIKIVFINQFGFYRRFCGQAMPEDMTFLDIRRGSDVEFGMSIYEPFGIAQLEPLTFGGICVISNVCGCAGFVNEVSNGESCKNVIVADYTYLDGQAEYTDLWELLQMDRTVRNEVESRVSADIARQIIQSLPKNDAETEEMIRTGYDLAKQMSWDVVVENHLLKNLRSQNKETICN
ncbi:hypothetical protein ACFL3G_04700 [Planctomycetota bacterium]